LIEQSGPRYCFKNGTGWLRPPAIRIPSPNCDDRPECCAPEAIIIHSISLPTCCYGGRFIEDLFGNRLSADAHATFAEIAPLKVSSHFLVRRGGHLIQFVDVGKRAWHAGVSRCLGRDKVNDFSIGIELEGCDYESFTMEQYRSLADLVRTLRAKWPNLGSERLFSHSDIAPERKTDPGPFFDWHRLHVLLQ
jgi:N-acetyl-anhydromuramoyl-L-alanine amidase